MDFSSSLNGIKSALGAQALNANNIANINSNSYKTKKPLTHEGKGGTIETRASVKYSQGSITPTGINTDVTVTGNASIQVESSDGTISHSRTLNMQLDGDGRLTDGKGNYISGVTGKIDDINSITIKEDGSILSKDKDGNVVEVGKLLLKNHNQESRQTINGAEKVLQGFTESSNVDLAEEMVGQMQNELSLKANISAIKTQDEMLGDIIDLKG